MSVLNHSESELYSISFFWISYCVRKIPKIFDNYSHSAKPVGKLDQLVH